MFLHLNNALSFLFTVSHSGLRLLWQYKFGFIVQSLFLADPRDKNGYRLVTVGVIHVGTIGANGNRPIFSAATDS